MKPDFWLRCALEPALYLLPPKMDTKPARAMCMAICLQESRLEHRHQIGGPAHGYGQFEQGGGVRGVLTHPASKPHILKVLDELDYTGADAQDCYEAIQHNDILAAAFVRLLLYTLPELLPVRGDPNHGWLCYQKAWRPGRPHPESWSENFANAWEAVS